MNQDQSEFHQLWPVPILITRVKSPEKLNGELLSLFYKHKNDHQKSPAKSYASNDDLIKVYKDNQAVMQLTKIIMDGIFDISAKANGKYWQRMSLEDIKVNVTGLWFQITNDYIFHEVHVHGNCSWSGVYYVQSGDAVDQSKSKELGFKNGITRFYGPHMEHMAGCHLDLGNVYLTHDKYDSIPEDGKLVIFPSYLKHMPFPYVGEKDRVIVSFHAGLSSNKKMQMNYSFA